MPRIRTLPLLLIVAIGCARTAPQGEAAKYDPDRARDALVAAMEAWKKGQAGTLAKRQPPIRFVDDDFVAGMSLVEYEVDEPDAPIALHTDVLVILSLKDRRGKPVRREAHYQIATEPALAVLRSDR
jgi:hypothetical protein